MCAEVIQGDIAEPAVNGKALVGGVETRREPIPKASLVPGEARSVLPTG